MKNKRFQKLTLFITIMMLTLFTNHIAKASEQLVFLPNSTVAGTILPGVKETVYMVPLSEAGTLTLRVDSYITSTSITLKDALGNPVFQEYAYDGKLNDPAKWIKSIDLESGVYYLTIKDGSYISKETGIFLVGNEFLPAKNQEVEPNNAIEIANALQLNGEPIRGFISWNDSVDYFKIDVKTSGNLKLNFGSYLDEVTFAVMDNSGKELFSEQVNGESLSKPEKLTKQLYLEKGTYFIKAEKVRYSTSTGVYTIQALLGNGDSNEIEPNNSPEQAQLLSLNGKTIKGNIALNDHVDYYKFVTSVKSNVAIDLSVYFKAVNFELIDVNGSVIESSVVRDGDENKPVKMSKEVELAAGTYFIKIEKQTNSNEVGAYELNVREASSSKGFQDVSARYKTAIDYLVEKNITQGISDTAFGVDGKIKRVDAAVMIAKALKLDTTTSKDAGFKDVPSRATNAVNALAERGILNGKSTTMFGSNDELTRGEMALILSRAYKLDGAGTTISFEDVTGKYSSAVAALVKNKITAGKTDTLFGTSDLITRGEMAIFLYRVEQLK